MSTSQPVEDFDVEVKDSSVQDAYNRSKEESKKANSIITSYLNETRKDIMYTSEIIETNPENTVHINPDFVIECKANGLNVHLMNRLRIGIIYESPESLVVDEIAAKEIIKTILKSNPKWINIPFSRFVFQQYKEHEIVLA